MVDTICHAVESVGHSVIPPPGSQPDPQASCQNDPQQERTSEPLNVWLISHGSRPGEGGTKKAPTDIHTLTPASNTYQPTNPNDLRNSLHYFKSSADQTVSSVITMTPCMHYKKLFDISR